MLKQTYHITSIIERATKYYVRLCRAMMSLGSSQPWGKALQILTGSSYYDVKPLLQYYEPIHRWLRAEIDRYDIPVGWE
jgi:hypothetical protein